MPLDGFNKAQTSRPANVIRGAFRQMITRGDSPMFSTSGVASPNTFRKGVQTISIPMVTGATPVGDTLSFALATGTVGTSENLGKLQGVGVHNPMSQLDSLHIAVSGTSVKDTSLGYKQLIDGRWVDSNGAFVTPSGADYSVKENVASSGDLSVSNPRTQDANFNTRLSLNDRTESLGKRTG
jgi:hypothetical protein